MLFRVCGRSPPSPTVLVVGVRGKGCCVVQQVVVAYFVYAVRVVCVVYVYACVSLFHEEILFWRGLSFPGRKVCQIICA